MDIEQLEQLAAVIVTAGLVAGNFLVVHTPWRDGKDPRRHHPESLIRQNGSMQRSANLFEIKP